MNTSAYLPSSQDAVRRNNLGSILRRLHCGGPASRSELVSMTGLNRGTVGALVAGLCQAGLVSEQPGIAGSVGRPSLVVEPTPDSAFVLAFDLHVDRIIAAAIGLSGTELSRKEQRYPRGGLDPEQVVVMLASIADRLRAEVPPGAAWVGTGVAVPAVIDARAGVVIWAPNLGWTDVPLSTLVKDALATQYADAPLLVIGNDADLGVIAEHTRGSAAGAHNVIYLSGEIGVGGGIVIDGQPLTGPGGFGGEVGHMLVDPSGMDCRCGSRGCWETVIGRDAILRGADRPLDTDLDHVVAAAHAGDARCRASLDEFGHWLGIGLRNLVNIVNPEVIVLGGHLGVLLPEVQSIVDAHTTTSIPTSLDHARVVAARLGHDSTLVGAAESAFAQLLASPLETLAHARAAGQTATPVASSKLSSSAVRSPRFVPAVATRQRT